MDQNDTPPLQRPEDTPPIHTQAELHGQWRALMGPLGFSRPGLWLMFLSAQGQTDGMITKVEDLPRRPDPQLLTNLLDICRQVLADGPNGSRVAFLFSRPGSRHVTADDRAWAWGLTKAARVADVRCEPVHLANDEEVRVLALDDLDLPETA